MVVAPTELGVEVIGETIQEFAAFLYAGDELISLHRMERLQRALNVLTERFN